MTIRFQRANFLVRNLERALHFYVDVLGFEVAFRKDSEEDSYSYMVFDIDRSQPMKFATLSTPSQVRAMALTEVPNLEAPVPPRRSAIVLEISNLDEVLEKARLGGYHVYEEEKLVTHDGRTGREVGVLDEDGNLAVLYYIPPGKGSS